MKFLGIEIGSWADIAAAIGTVGAVWIALTQSRSSYKMRFEDKQIEDLTAIYRLLIKMNSISDMIKKAKNHFEYYESDGIETISGNEDAKTDMMKKVNKEMVESILAFETDIDELDVIKDLLSDTFDNAVVKDGITNFKMSLLAFRAITGNIKQHEIYDENPDEKLGSQYLWSLQDIDENYTKLKQIVGENIRKIKGNSA